jgi:hypothetical protein
MALHPQRGVTLAHICRAVLDPGSVDHLPPPTVGRWPNRSLGCLIHVSAISSVFEYLPAILADESVIGVIERDGLMIGW